MTVHAEAAKRKRHILLEQGGGGRKSFFFGDVILSSARVQFLLTIKNVRAQVPARELR